MTKKLKNAKFVGSSFIFRTTQTSCQSTQNYFISTGSSSRRTDVNTAMLTYNVLTTQQPTHLHHLLQLYQHTITLCSSNQQLLQILYVKTEFVQRSFSCGSPKILNNIAATTKVSGTIDTLKCWLLLIWSPTIAQLSIHLATACTFNSSSSRYYARYKYEYY